MKKEVITLEELEEFIEQTFFGKIDTKSKKVSFGIVITNHEGIRDYFMELGYKDSSDVKKGLYSITPFGVQYLGKLKDN